MRRTASPYSSLVAATGDALRRHFERVYADSLDGAHVAE